MRSAFTIFRGAVVAGALTLGFPVASYAAASGDNESTPLHLTATTAHHSSSVGGGSILRTIVALVIVIGLIYGIARVMKAVKGGGGSQRATGEGLEHLATLPLAQGRSVSLLRSGSDVVLVGISEQGITPIKVYSQSEALMNGIALPAGDPVDDMTVIDAERPVAGGVIEVLRRLTVRV